MPKVFAGTAYSQIIVFDPLNKRKQKEVFGAPARQPVLHLSHYQPSHLTLYSTSKTLTSLFQSQTNEILKIYSKETIVSATISSVSDQVEYALSNGAIYETTVTKVLRKEAAFEEIYKGEGHSSFVGAAQSLDESKNMFYGKGVVP